MLIKNHIFLSAILLYLFIDNLEKKVVFIYALDL